MRRAPQPATAPPSEPSSPDRRRYHAGTTSTSSSRIAKVSTMSSGSRTLGWRTGCRQPLRLGPVLSLMLSAKWLLLLGMLAHVSLAVLVPFDNCLQESYKSNDPLPLQWKPLEVEASFDTTNPQHTLVVTMRGNVTGSSTNVALPPPDSPDWNNVNKTDGKILNEPDPNAPNPKLTTLHSKIEVLSYEPWSNNTNFCNALGNGSCPLGPAFNNATALPSVTLSHNFTSSYAFTSFSATFLVIYGDARGTNIGCVSATVTPDLGNLAWMLKFLPLIVLIFVAVATVFAGIYSPWGSADIFHWTSNFGRDADLLRLVTPGFGDCLQYIQFVALTGSLTLNYPGFYQPIVSQASWSVLLFNQSFVSRDAGWNSIQDGIYVTRGPYGLQHYAQLVGLGKVEDIWAGMMIYVLVIIAAMVLLVQGGFLVQWVYRAIKKIPEEDLRAKNIPFTLGNMVRIVLNFFLLPIVAMSTFQLVVASESPAFTVGLAVVTLVLIIVFAVWLLYLIVTTKPRAFLFDDLPTVLLYGPLYNTYSDEAAAFALIPVLLTFLRGIAVGAVQPAGVAQIVILAICEVIQILTLHAFRPFHSPTSMNAYHTLFSALRFITVLLMVAFVPSMGVGEGTKGWIGYAILLIHAGVLVLGFFLNAVQTIVEVAARMLGAGGDSAHGLARGGLSKIFGMRQLSRRNVRREREAGPSRSSQLSSSAMLDAAEASKPGYVMPGGRLRSESAGSMGIMQRRDHTALENLHLDSPSRNMDSATSAFTPTTPGDSSTFSFAPSPGIPARAQSGLGIQPADPYYRPPRQRRQTLDVQSSPASKTVAAAQKRTSLVGVSPLGAPFEIDVPPRGETPNPYAQAGTPLTPRTDYSTREVDFYYGVRGERLNSEGPSRKLGTGPADPTGPMASAAGWIRTMFGAKGKDKGKGFEVVRSARMPPSAGGNYEEEAPPQGIPVALGVIRNGPIDSDDEDDVRQARAPRARAARAPETSLLDDDAGLSEDTTLNEAETSRSTRARAMSGTGALPSIPSVPRKSSKRTPDHSRAPSAEVRLSRASSNIPLSATTSSRLPFERSPSQRRLSGASSAHPDLQDVSGTQQERSTSYGFVHQGSVNRVNRDADLLGSSAEVVDERRR
ncbi:putative flavin carrier protein 3 [Podospora aff. communis PSN243]|uniref:Flavin carrier protein 3 n=1 Tax=Podospora aff. communis PSN243 TaxID=3040156 RepID=A0AAV9GPF2_9PEZI|nr:putative flavin carrier protein 3 [Podospora aff. communis PSN243]